MDRLQALNQIADAYRVPPGTRLRIPLDWARKRPGLARVVAATGESTVIRAGDGTSSAITLDSRINAGDTVTCAANSYATLQFEDDSRLRVQADSQIRLEAAWVYGDAGFFASEIALERGRTENEVPAREPSATRLRIRTPAAITSVRGTRFRVSTETIDSSSRSEVLRGQVGVVARGKVVPVNAGFGTLTHAGKAPSPPVPLLPAPDLASLPSLLERVPLRFELTPLAGAAGYRAQVATDPTFNALVADFSADSPIMHGPDIANGVYWLRVRGSDAHRIEGVDGVHRFTLHARPEPPFIIEPQAGGGTDVIPQFRWAAHPDATHYELEVAAAATFTAPLIAERSLRETSYRAANAFAPGHYFWRIASVSAHDGRGPMSDSMPFRVPHPGPTADAPNLSRTALSIQWSGAAPGHSFQFQLATNESFADLRVDQRVDAPRIELKRPRGGHYFMRIRTIEADGFSGPFGTAQKIDIPPSPYWLLVLLPLAWLL
ncbi:MAG: FecR domain-containing protein [Porticoccaceae bacterium]